MQISKTYRYNTYAKIAGVLLLIGGIQFLLGVVIGESQYPGYNTSKNTLSDMSCSCPSIDPSNPLKCVNSVILQPSATIFSTIVFVIGLTAVISAYFIHMTLGGKIAPKSNVSPVVYLPISTLFFFVSSELLPLVHESGHCEAFL